MREKKPKPPKKRKKMRFFHELRRSQFIEAYRRTGGHFRKSVKAVKISATTVYKWMDKDKDFMNEIKKIQDDLFEKALSGLNAHLEGPTTVKEIEKEVLDRNSDIVKLHEVHTTKHPPTYEAVDKVLRKFGKSYGFSDELFPIDNDQPVTLVLK